MIVLRGSNGCGKSTLLRLLAGFIPLESGMLSWRGEVVNQDREILSSDILYLGHAQALKNVLTLYENLSDFSSIVLGHRANAEDIEAAATRFNMQHLLHEPVQYFSSGQRHRAGLVRFALAAKKIWLMDEPTVGLDSENRQALAALIQQHLIEGGIAIAATHDPLGVDGTLLDVSQFTPKQDDPQTNTTWDEETWT